VAKCAVACALALVVLGVLAFTVDAAHARDVATLHGFTGLYGASAGAAIRILARIADPLPYGLMGLGCIAVAAGRGRTWTAAAVAVLLVATGATTQALKHVLDQPRHVPSLPWDPVGNQWPSGHATAAMTLALCAVMVAPPAWRAVTALVGWSATVALAYATLALTWHYPSDVLAGLLVAGLWVSGALALLLRIEPGDPRAPRPPRIGALVVLGAAGTAVGGAVVALASGRVALDAQDRVLTVATAMAIGALALALLVLTAIRAPEGEP
jgi:membrane-associated phospholipid phosphatase